MHATQRAGACAMTTYDLIAHVVWAGLGATFLSHVKPQQNLD